MFQDSYKQLKSPSKAIYKEKGSKFLAYCYPVYNELDVKKILEKIKKLEQSATHYCYAYVLNPDKSSQRANDDGEPSSTAGKPILGQILSNDLTNILIVVVRYYGGIKLGITGLIRSYKTAASEAISKAEIVERTILEKYEVKFNYSQMNDVMKLVKEFNVEVIERDIQLDCKIIFTISKTKANKVFDTFKRNHNLVIKYLKTI